MPPPQAQPPIATAQETWRYVLGYLIAATAVFAVITAGVAIYNATAAARHAEGTQALAEGNVRAAFEALHAPHLFSGRRPASAVLPSTDALREHVEGEAEERLAKAFSAAESLPAPGPHIGRPEDCGGDPVCLVLGLMRPRQGDRGVPERLRAYAYFAARRAMARGEEPSGGVVAVLERYPSFWVRAFERQVMAADGQPTSEAPVMLARLGEELDASVHGAWVFAGYGGLVTTILAVATLIWWRRRRPGEEA